MNTVNEKSVINNYLNKYFNENFEEVDISIVDTENGYEVDMGNSEVIYVEVDSLLGWHCYGDIANNDIANKIEFDLEHYLDTINMQYYYVN